MRYHDAAGNQISRDDWCLLYSQTSYRRVAQTKVHDRYWVITSWIGFNTATKGKALYFETAIFDTLDRREFAIEEHRFIYEAFRTVAGYPNRDAARRGHRRIVAQIRGGEIPELH